MDKEGTCLNKIKVIYDKPTANITLNGKKLKVFHLRAGTRLSSTVATFIQHSFVNPSHSNYRRKRNYLKKKRLEKTIKLSLCEDDTLLYIDNPKDTTRKLLDLINEFGNVARYKNNT